MLRELFFKPHIKLVAGRYQVVNSRGRVVSDRWLSWRTIQGRNMLNWDRELTDALNDLLASVYSQATAATGQVGS